MGSETVFQYAGLNHDPKNAAQCYCSHTNHVYMSIRTKIIHKTLKICGKTNLSNPVVPVSLDKFSNPSIRRIILENVGLVTKIMLLSHFRTKVMQITINYSEN